MSVCRRDRHARRARLHMLDILEDRCLMSSAASLMAPGHQDAVPVQANNAQADAQPSAAPGSNGLGPSVRTLTHEGVHGQALASDIHQMQGKGTTTSVPANSPGNGGQDQTNDTPAANPPEPDAQAAVADQTANPGNPEGANPSPRSADTIGSPVAPATPIPTNPAPSSGVPGPTAASPAPTTQTPVIHSTPPEPAPAAQDAPGRSDAAGTAAPSTPPATTAPAITTSSQASNAPTAPTINATSPASQGAAAAAGSPTHGSSHATGERPAVATLRPETPAPGNYAVPTLVSVASSPVVPVVTVNQAVPGLSAPLSIGPAGAEEIAASVPEGGVLQRAALEVDAPPLPAQPGVGFAGGMRIDAAATIFSPRDGTIIADLDADVLPLAPVSGYFQSLADWAARETERGWLPWLAAVGLTAAAGEITRRQLRPSGDGERPIGARLAPGWIPDTGELPAGDAT